MKVNDKVFFCGSGHVGVCAYMPMQIFLYAYLYVCVFVSGK